MTDQPPGQPAGHFHRIPVTVQATAYVRAANADEARRKLYDAIQKDPILEVGDDSCGWISGRRFDDPDLPVVSLSPAMTISDAIAPVVQISQVSQVSQVEEVDP